MRLNLIKALFFLSLLHISVAKAYEILPAPELEGYVRAASGYSPLSGMPVSFGGDYVGFDTSNVAQTSHIAGPVDVQIKSEASYTPLPSMKTKSYTEIDTHTGDASSFIESATALFYEFRVIGETGTSVPVHLTGLATTSVGAGASGSSVSATAYFGIRGCHSCYDFGHEYSEVSVDGLDSQKNTNYFNDTYWITADESYTIVITNSERSNATKGYTESNAYIDPYISLDDEYSGRYSIELSPGVGNAMSTVSLPASAPLFGAALMALGAVGYGVKRKARASA